VAAAGTASFSLAIGDAGPIQERKDN